MRFSPLSYRIFRLVFLALAMGGIFAADTATSYEVAASVFYAVVILTAASALSRRALIGLTAVCIVMTVLSFAFTPHGDYRAGLINTGISIAAIVVTAYLVLKMEAARAATHAAQAQLMRMARVKSLEGLTTSIAHEVNQPLAAIVTSGNACQRWLGQAPPNLDKARQAIDRMLSDAGRASNIIARVRSLTKGEAPHKSEFDFNEAVLEVLTLSQSEMERNRILLTAELSSELPAALADRVQVQQVVGNLVLNAIEALTSASTPRRNIRIVSEPRGDAILLSVIDTGGGLPIGVYEHLFEAFWTTKQEGIGVGLSISRAIIESNGGQIWAEQAKEGGAAFRFSVPTALRERSQ